MSIKVERNDGLTTYYCKEPNCNFYAYFYRNFMKHVWNEHKKKRGIQTNFKDNSLNNYELIKLSGGVEE